MTFYKLGILGYPLGHSLSPILQSYFLEQAGLDGSYEKFEIPPDFLGAWIQASADLGLSGWNVTIPHKVAVMPYLKEISESARLIGAVNTIVVKPDGLYGENTDAYGFMAPLSKIVRKQLQGGHAVILGTGGASRAVAYSLLKLGVKHLTFWARNPEKAQPLLKMAQDAAVVLNPTATVDLYATLSEEILSDTVCLVNTTPVGMMPEINEMPISKELLKALPQSALVYDLVYRPLQTELLKQAEQLNLSTQDGLAMLIYQGAMAFEHWTGIQVCDAIIAGAKQVLLAKFK